MSLLTRIVPALLACCLSLSGHADSPGRHGDCPVLDLSDDTARQHLMDHVCYHTASPGDPGHEARSPDQLPENFAWTPANGHDLVFSHTESVYWIHLHVWNGGDPHRLWYLKLDYPLLDEVSFWQTGPDGYRSSMITGDQYPFASRQVNYRYFLLPLALARQEQRQVTIRVHSSGALNVPLALETPEEVIASSNHLTLTHGLFYGALVIFAAFNLLLFFSSGTPYYFHNAFYMAAMGLFLFAMGGFANQYFWPESAHFANLAIPISLTLCALAMTLFGRSFLEVQADTLPATTLTTLAWFCLGFLALTFILPYSKSILLNTVLALTVIASLLVVAAIRWRQGYPPAVWYLLSWIVMLAGALVYALAAFGYLADFLARESLMQATIGGQVVLLNYALVQRWRLLNEKLLQMEHQARTELEFKVHERTAQLRSTMHELERANRKLAALSLNDALTGLHNRRHMDAALPELCAESRRTGQPLSLALIDADRFKAINDTWGHAFGDVCLQRIAEVLQRHAKRPRDVAIRFGGEEFALLLPGTDAQGARQLCEHILADLRHLVVATPDRAGLTLTMSAGVAQLVPGEAPESLFQRADEALYQAKSSGRDRVCVAALALSD